MTNRNELERMQPMTTEQKALALVNEEIAEWGGRSMPLHIAKAAFGRCFEALLAAIEAHEADKKAFSDAAKEAVAMIENGESYNATDQISPFILPEPEPDQLVDTEDPINALVDLLAPVLTHSQGMAARERENRFRNAMATIMAKIERIEQ